MRDSGGSVNIKDYALDRFSNHYKQVWNAPKSLRSQLRLAGTMKQEKLGKGLCPCLQATVFDGGGSHSNPQDSKRLLD
jgi:hypothetical protein